MEYSLGVREVKGEVEVGRPEDVVDLLGEYRDLEREVMLVVHLDSNLDAKYIQTSAIGNKTACCYDTSDIFREAIVRRSDAIILVHNHPGEKKVYPSKDDLYCTKKNFEASKTVNIPLLDHVLLGKNDWFSFSNEGIIFPKCSVYVLETERFSLRKGQSKVKNMLRKVNQMGGFILRHGKALTRR